MRPNHIMKQNQGHFIMSLVNNLLLNFRAPERILSAKKSTGEK